MVYRYCIVPGCRNTTISSPGKTFINLPGEQNQRKIWLKAMKRQPKDVSSKSHLYLCEDHFNLEQDMENYMEWKMMGVQKRMKRHVVPHIFACQEHRKLTVSDKQFEEKSMDTGLDFVKIKEEPLDQYDISVDTTSTESTETKTLIENIKSEENEDSFPDDSGHIFIKQENLYPMYQEDSDDSKHYILNKLRSENDYSPEHHLEDLRIKQEELDHLISCGEDSTENNYETNKCSPDKEIIFERRRKWKATKRIVEDIELLKPYKCSECDYRFRKKTYLKDHFLVHMSPEKVQMISCSECSFKTKHRSNIKRHIMRKHSKGPRPAAPSSEEERIKFFCPECCFGTKYKSSLNRHILTHRNASSGVKQKSRKGVKQKKKKSNI